MGQESLVDDKFECTDGEICYGDESTEHVGLIPILTSLDSFSLTETFNNMEIWWVWKNVVYTILFSADPV